MRSSSKDQHSAYRTTAPPQSGDGELNVSLYDVVPNYAAFQNAVQAAWDTLGTGYTLNWATYDPYGGPPPPTLDVFAFDCIYAAELRANSNLQPIPWTSISAPDDFLPWVFSAVQIDDYYAYAVPYLGCVSTLYWRSDDHQIPGPTPSLGDLMEVLGPVEGSGLPPATGVGLLIELAGKTTDSCLYVASWEEQNDQYGANPPLPTADELDPATMASLALLVSMAGSGQAAYTDPGFVRTTWFECGLGRALVGVTETMAHIAPEGIDALLFAPLPLSPAGGNQHTPCYVDAIGLRPGLSPADYEAALKFANLASSSEVLVAACNPAGGSPQYLIPGRQSALSELAGELRTYERISSLIAEANPSPLRLGSRGREWVYEVGPTICSELLGTPLRRFAPEPLRPAAHPSTPAGLWRKGD